MPGQGPVPGATCDTCQHADRALIEAALRGGKSVTSTAKAFGLGKDALLRHRQNHMQMPALPGGLGEQVWKPKPGQSRADALDEVIASVASGKMRPDQAAQIRIALKEREEAGAPESVEVRLRDVEGLSELLADMLDALDPFPQAFAALRAVLAKHGLLGG
jgi:transposase-like protein